ncbi:MAG: histidine kinase [Desulfovibrio sp.]|nr:histidine kinase [Desulfovibrio sp.]
MNTFLDVLPVGVFVLDREFQIVEINSNIELFFGAQRSEMLQRDKREFIDNHVASIVDNFPLFSEKILSTYDNNSYIQDILVHILPGQERRERWLSHYSKPILDGDYAGGRVEIYTDVTEQVEAEEHINWLSSHVLQLQEKEKKRIARDLHDELGQRIVAQKMGLENLANHLHRVDPLLVEERLRGMIREFDLLSTEVQRISNDLMPSLLEPLGLDETLIWLQGKMEELYQLKVDYQQLGLAGNILPKELEVVIFRIVQEGFNNIVKHARATQVTLRIIYSYPKIVISIQDNGQGFSATSPRLGLGLRFMRQRVSEVGGTLRITTHPGQGTSLRLEIPFYPEVKA